LLDSTQIILGIADGTLSVSRIKRIAKALHGIDLDTQQIVEVTKSALVSTPHRQKTNDLLFEQYPDRYSVLLEAKSFWERVRRYWGDSAALKLKQGLEKAIVDNWRGLYSQFAAYTTSAIYDRADIDLKATNDNPLELERLYPWDIQKDAYLHGFNLNFAEQPESKQGALFPLPSPEYKEFRQAKFRVDCIEKCDRTWADERSLIDWFGEFWKAVYANRGERYFDKLRSELHGREEQESRLSFYSASEKHFKHFLRNLEGFKTSAPWRIPLNPNLPDNLPLPMALEGAILKYGWQNVENIAVLGVLAV
jgi:hypothetical protein